MLLVGQLTAIVNSIKHPEYEYMLKWDDERPYLQIRCEDKCNVTGEPLVWHGRKWLISRHMTPGEVVQTALMATLVASEHEHREKFTYKGVTVFDPHLDIEAIVTARRSGSLPIKGREETER